MSVFFTNINTLFCNPVTHQNISLDILSKRRRGCAHSTAKYFLDPYSVTLYQIFVQKFHVLRHIDYNIRTQIARVQPRCLIYSWISYPWLVVFYRGKRDNAVMRGNAAMRGNADKYEFSQNQECRQTFIWPTAAINNKINWHEKCMGHIAIFDFDIINLIVFRILIY